MSERHMTKLSTEVAEQDRSIHSRISSNALHNFFLNIPDKVQKCLEVNFKKLKNNDNAAISSINKSNRRSAIDFDINLEKQLQAWKANPSWVDHTPDIKVSVPRGSLCNLNVKVNVGLPPDAVFNIVTDPDNKRVFKNIKEVLSRRILVDEGSRQVVEVEQAAIWRFLWWSGTISVHVLVDQNREDYSMNFKQIKTGFMKRFEGRWRVEPIFVDEEVCHPLRPKTLAEYNSCTKGKGRIGSRVSLEQLIQPSIVPPPPISWYLRGITARTTEMIINDLLAEAARLRGSPSSEDSERPRLHEDEHAECSIRDTCSIKERWALRRRNARHCKRRLSL